MAVYVTIAIPMFMPRWHSWIARSPPKGQVRGSNPLRGAIFFGAHSGDMGACPSLVAYFDDIISVAYLCIHLVSFCNRYVNKYLLNIGFDVSILVTQKA